MIIDTDDLTKEEIARLRAAGFDVPEPPPTYFIPNIGGSVPSSTTVEEPDWALWPEFHRRAGIYFTTHGEAQACARFMLDAWKKHIEGRDA